MFRVSHFAKWGLKRSTLDEQFSTPDVTSGNFPKRKSKKKSNNYLLNKKGIQRLTITIPYWQHHNNRPFPTTKREDQEMLAGI
jgi:hypothetical protein